MPTLACYRGLLFRHLFHHPDGLVPCLLRLPCLLADAVEVGRGVQGSLGILGAPQLLLRGNGRVRRGRGGMWAGGGHMFGDGVMGGVQCGAGGAAGGCPHITLCANACLIAWTSARKVAISCAHSEWLALDATMVQSLLSSWLYATLQQGVGIGSYTIDIDLIM